MSRDHGAVALSHTLALLRNSTEVDILLCGNGALHAMLAVRARARAHAVSAGFIDATMLTHPKLLALDNFSTPCNSLL
jgi:hypothetical protein